jgi:hypothetical protein
MWMASIEPGARMDIEVAGMVRPEPCWESEFIMAGRDAAP